MRVVEVAALYPYVGSATQLRQPAGTPVGGQFAPTSRPEATGIHLTEDPDPPLEDDIAASTVLAEATVWGKRYAHRYGVEAADVIGATALAFYEQRARRAAAGKPPIKDIAYLNTLARNIALQAIGADRSYIRQAFRRYRQRCAERTQELGRSLSRREEDEIAAAIIAAQEPRRRAPADFHHRRRTVSLDAPAHRYHGRDTRGESQSSDETMAELLAAPDDPTEGIIERESPLGAIGERAAQLAATGDHARAKRLAWDALAELSGAPKVQPSVVTERHAARARKVIAEAGGAYAVARSYDQGLAGQDVMAALFAPFGAIDDSKRDAVVATLLGHPHLAGELWDLALRSATAPRANAAQGAGA